MFVFCILREYGELIRDRVEGFGVLVDMIHLSPTVSLADALDAAANRGLLYAVIVTAQHEMHRSVTLTILHGRNPQGKVYASWKFSLRSCPCAIAILYLANILFIERIEV